VLEIDVNIPPVPAFHGPFCIRSHIDPAGTGPESKVAFPEFISIETISDHHEDARRGRLLSRDPGNRYAGKKQDPQQEKCHSHTSELGTYHGPIWPWYASVIFIVL